MFLKIIKICMMIAFTGVVGTFVFGIPYVRGYQFEILKDISVGCFVVSIGATAIFLLLCPLYIFTREK